MVRNIWTDDLFDDRGHPEEGKVRNCLLRRTWEHFANIKDPNLSSGACPSAVDDVAEVAPNANGALTGLVPGKPACALRAGGLVRMRN
jgi:hypothetical protein